jgi:hypothetical protein
VRLKKAISGKIGPKRKAVRKDGKVRLNNVQKISSYLSGRQPARVEIVIEDDSDEEVVEWANFADAEAKSRAANALAERA